MTARRCQVTAGLLTLVLAMAAAPRAATAQEPLTPQDVLRAVDRALPLIEQARRDVDAAAGDLVSARGAFDLSLSASGRRLDGEYDNTRLSTMLEQPLTTWGATAYGGYRAGRGTFADYDGKAETTGGGEVLAGLEVPLLPRSIRPGHGVQGTPQRAALEVPVVGLPDPARSACSTDRSCCANRRSSTTRV